MRDFLSPELIWGSEGGIYKGRDDSQLRGRRDALILYQTEDAKTRIDVRLQNETVWLIQKLVAELFQAEKGRQFLNGVKGGHTGTSE